MQEIKLSKKEKADLEYRHKQSKNAKECDRLKAILLRSEGWNVAMIAQALRIHESTIIRHLNDYRLGKLSISSGGSTGLMNEFQTQALISHLVRKTYQSTQEIIAYIQKAYGLTYSIPGFEW